MSNPLFLNTILFGDFPIERKLAAVKAAGFDQVEVWKEDCAAMTGGARALSRLCADLGLKIASIMVLRDAIGSPDGLRAAKRREALDMMNLALELGTDCIQAPANTRSDVDPGHADADMSWLAEEASSRHLRISYEAVAWATLDRDLSDAIARLRRLDHPGFGLELDFFHACVRGGSLAPIDDIRVEDIFQIQLSDLLPQTDISSDEKLIFAARHERVLPGAGHFSFATSLKELLARGCKAPIGIEVFSDKMRSLEPEHAALSAMESLRNVLA